MTQVQEKKDVVVNGSRNLLLTPPEIAELNTDEKKTLLNYMQSDLQGVCNLRNIAQEAKFKSAPLYEYKEIQKMKDAELLQAITKTQTEINRKAEQLKELTKKIWNKAGEQILEAQQRLQFTGELYMEIEKLDGYLTAVGAWNDCDPEKIVPFLYKIHEQAPKLECGVNNCNTGSQQHKWAVNNDYIYMVVEFCSGKDAQRWEDFYKKVVEPQRDAIYCDSMRFVKEEAGVGHYKLYISMWWD